MGADVWVALEYDRRLGTGSYEDAVLLCEQVANVGRSGYWTEWTGGDPVSTMDQLGPVARPDARSGTGYRVVRIGHGPGTAARDDHGHRPLLINENMCGGCEVCGDAEEMEICARCFPVTYEPGWAWVLDPGTGEMVSRFGRWPTYGTVPWPCASAVVLGLTPTTWPDPGGTPCKLTPASAPSTTTSRPCRSARTTPRSPRRSTLPSSSTARTSGRSRTSP